MPKHNRFLAWALAACALAVLAGCVTGPRVRTDYDPSADFSRFRTWNFYDPIAMEEAGYTTWISDRIKDDIRREMSARGYRYQEKDADLRVNFQGIVQEKTDVYSTPRLDYQYFYGYRSRRYFAVPVWYDQTQVNQYREGTLTVDLVDGPRNRMVWTGAAIGRVVSRRTPQERLAEVDQAITSVFAEFPYSAASAQPANSGQ